MKVTFFHRLPNSENFSVEWLFEIIREALPSDIEARVAVSRYESRGLFKRLYNVFEAANRQGDINHITGDVHFLAYLLRKKKTLLTVLDCAFTQNPSALKRALLRFFWYTLPARKASYISVISESSRRELLEHIDYPEERIRVIPACVSPRFAPKPKPFNAEKPIILQVGTRANKNLLRLAEALEGIPCKLDIVGRLTPEQRLALEERHIEYRNSFDLSEDEIIARYEACDMLAFVSTYEGFGMPILEANTVERPVVTSNLLSMPEVAGKAACLVDPFDVPSIRNGLLKVIQEADYREQLIANGRANRERYSPRAVAAQYAALYREMLSGSPRGR